MKLPNKINISGTVYELKQEEILEDGNAGITQVMEKTITLDPRLVGLDQIRVLLHEIFHAKLWEVHLSQNDGWVDKLIEEIIVDSLSSQVVELFEIKWKKNTHQSKKAPPKKKKKKCLKRS